MFSGKCAARRSGAHWLGLGIMLLALAAPAYSAGNAQVSDFTAPTTLLPLRVFNTTCIIRNTGTETVKVVLSVYISQDSIVNDQDTKVTTFELTSEIPPGAGTQVDAFPAVIDIMPPGEYYIAAVLKVLEGTDSNPLDNVSNPVKVEVQGFVPRAPTNIGTYAGGRWRMDVDGDGAFDPAKDRGFNLGWPGATHFTGDWNGDGRTKAGVYANGFWFLDYDGNGVWDGGINDKLVAWGWDGATPFVGDWNGDGRTDVGVYNLGFWFLDYDGNYVWNDVKPFAYGWDGATPLVGDWNGDGKTDVGVYNLGFWFLDYNGDRLWDNGVLDKIVAWGWPGSTPITGDWNGDGRTKIGTYAGGYWYPDYEGGYRWEYPTKGSIWIVGWTGVTPIIGDWNKDGKSKAGAFYNGYWYLDYNGNGIFEGAETDRIYAFGDSTDTPLAGRW
jgi:hypothetical protein